MRGSISARPRAAPTRPALHLAAAPSRHPSGALRALLAAHADIRIVGESADGREALPGLAATRPDLLFLDIQMPGFDGFQVLETLGPADLPQVIFVSAHDHYAIRAFDVHALAALCERDRRQGQGANGARAWKRGSIPNGSCASIARGS